MKTPAYFAISTLLLTSGCGPDVGMVDPLTSGNDVKPSLASERFSDWSSPVNLGAPVNSAVTEQHPALSKDGLSLYFASNRITGDQNLWVAHRACTDISPTECPWSEPVMLGNNVNSSSLEAAPTLSRDQHQLFFISQRPREAPRRPGDTCAAAPCDRDIWVSYRDDVHDDLAWQPAVNLGAPVNTNGHEVAPSYFENDDSGLPQLFFNDGVVENGILVRGDIYVSQLASDGTWSKPSPLLEINTSFSDQRPAVSHDGLELYFHSTRPIAGGGAAIARIWVATRQLVSDPWSAPTLVPSPISDVQTIHPFIHSHGKTETLLFVRSGDIWMSERTKIKAAE